MTNIIQPYNYSSTTQAADAAPTSKNASSTSLQQPAPGADVESVTLSSAAQTNNALVNAARDAKGINQTHVNAIKQALANGTYNVSPEDLANAISSVLDETRE